MDHTNPTTVARLSLTRRDVEVLRHLAAVRCLDTGQIEMLLGADGSMISRKGLVRRLQRLRQAKYIQVLRNQSLVRLNPDTGRYAGRVRLAYALSTRGAAELGLDTSHRVRHDRLNRDIQDPQIRHSLLSAGVYTALQVACRQASNLELAYWQHENSPGAIVATFFTDEDNHLLSSIAQRHSRERGIRRIVKPDAFFVLHRRDTDEDVPCFLEADRSTMDQSRFLEKLASFDLFRTLGLAKRLFGIEDFLVLTVTLNNPSNPNLLRRDTLRRAARRLFSTAEAASRYRFATANDYQDPRRISQKIWYLAADDAIDQHYHRPFNLYQ